MVMNKPMKGPVKGREEIPCYLFKSLNSSIIFHTKILNDALNMMLKHRATHPIQAFFFLITVEKKNSSNQPYLAYLANTLKI